MLRRFQGLRVLVVTSFGLSLGLLTLTCPHALGAGAEGVSTQKQIEDYHKQVYVELQKIKKSEKQKANNTAQKTKKKVNRAISSQPAIFK